MEIFVGLVVVLCLHSGIYGDKNGGMSEDEKLEALEERLFEHVLQEYPEFATVTGCDVYDQSLTEYTQEAFSRRKVANEALVTELHSITFHKLSRQHKMRYTILMDHLQTFLEGYKWRKFGTLNPINVMESLFSKSSSWFLPKGDLQKHFKRYRGRFVGYPKQAADLINLMRRAIELNRTNHIYAMGRTHEMNEWFNNMMLLFRKPERFYEIPSDDQMEIYHLLSKLQDTVDTVRRFLMNEYLPNTRPEPGVSSLPGGREYYEACLKFHTGLPLTAEKVHAIGLREVRRIRLEMQKVMDKLEFNGTLIEFFHHLKTAPGLYNLTQEELISENEYNIHELIEPRLWTVFKDIEHVPVRVEGTRLARFPWGGYNNGTFGVNILMAEKKPVFIMMPLTLHEADPGHHFQNIYPNVPDLPKYRRWIKFGEWHAVPFMYPSFTAYIEGWALYSEYLGEEMGLYNDTYTLFGRYVFEMFRASRLVVDTGIHAFGWTRDDGVEYMMKFTGFPKEILQRDVNQFIAWPGHACAYKIGEMKIKELRNMSERRLESLFSVKEFHDVILRIGPVSLGVLEDVVDEWVTETLLLATSVANITKSVSVLHAIVLFCLVNFLNQVLMP
ncbi:uncharacterized protein LOC110452143 [Mizuhopecten yessoensis]|uniref:Uncharacterized protein n=1 Tax=Mizuhopecten yessoensis TaxID=6573 RepID=A0A210R6Y5_MIZYE|nr:uncharacterized protein LOC110452143 [Mizuhopecten yessoensis]OWF56827.1 hypothetical protein KP79_PYT20754 [Mizuhopecten yessoensis]